VLGATEAEAEAKRARLDPGPSVLVGGPERVAEAIRSYGDAGAEWVIVGPVDSSDPENAVVLGERVKPLLRP
jgi:alkanesulfonate monooxygenase SsuD/methylene tetrahydromethanopterin reductase-like flavin-dependent oxidoreductase (luciferase family)